MTRPLTTAAPATSSDGAPPPVLRLHQACKSFGDHQALDHVSLEVGRGEVVVVVDPSGSGKSTLVRCVHQLERIDAGAMCLGGELLGHERHGGSLRPLGERRIAAQRRRIGMLFQQFHLFPHRTVLENVIEAPIRVHRRDRDAATREVMVLLDRVGLADRADHYPRQLAGGQQQRVAIARALATEPERLLFDAFDAVGLPQRTGSTVSRLAPFGCSRPPMAISRCAHRPTGSPAASSPRSAVRNSPTRPGSVRGPARSTTRWPNESPEAPAPAPRSGPVSCGSAGVCGTTSTSTGASTASTGPSSCGRCTSRWQPTPNSAAATTPLRALAARFAAFSDQLYTPPWSAEWYVKEARLHGVDGVVHLVSDDPRGSHFTTRALEAAGIPVLELHADNVDSRPADRAVLDRTLSGWLTERVLPAREQEALR